MQVIVTSEEMSANAQGDSEIDLVGEAPLFLSDNDMGCKSSGEVVHDEAGKDLLSDERHLFRVEGGQPDGVFQFTKGSFDSPAHGIKFLDLARREQAFVQIRDDRFIGIDREPKSNDAQGHGIEFVFMRIEEIKGAFAWDEVMTLG
jgi:hypothetical protein